MSKARIILIIYIFLIISCTYSSIKKHECFDWKLMSTYYLDKTGEGIYDNNSNTVTYVDEYQRKVEKYWLNSDMKAIKYRMYNWHYKTSKAYFSMDFSDKDCNVTLVEGNPFFIESNIEERKDTYMDSLVFYVQAAITPFTTSELSVYKKGKNDTTIMFSGQLESNRLYLPDHNLANEEYEYHFKYKLKKDSVLIISDSIRL